MSQTSERAPLFTNTHWSQVLLAANPLEDTKAAAALEYLCRIYWYPLYAYMRRSGYHAEEALTENNLGGAMRLLQPWVKFGVNLVAFSPDGRILAASTYWFKGTNTAYAVHLFRAPSLAEIEAREAKE